MIIAKEASITYIDIKYIICYSIPKFERYFKMAWKRRQTICDCIQFNKDRKLFSILIYNTITVMRWDSCSLTPKRETRRLTQEWFYVLVWLIVHPKHHLFFHSYFAFAVVYLRTLIYRIDLNFPHQENLVNSTSWKLNPKVSSQESSALHKQSSCNGKSWRSDFK